MKRQSFIFVFCLVLSSIQTSPLSAKGLSSNAVRRIYAVTVVTAAVALCAANLKDIVAAVQRTPLESVQSMVESELKSNNRDFKRGQGPRYSVGDIKQFSIEEDRQIKKLLIYLYNNNDWSGKFAANGIKNVVVVRDHSDQKVEFSNDPAIGITAYISFQGDKTTWRSSAEMLLNRIKEHSH